MAPCYEVLANLHIQVLISSTFLIPSSLPFPFSPLFLPSLPASSSYPLPFPFPSSSIFSSSSFFFTPSHFSLFLPPPLPPALSFLITFIHDELCSHFIILFYFSWYCCKFRLYFEYDMFSCLISWSYLKSSLSRINLFGLPRLPSFPDSWWIRNTFYINFSTCGALRFYGRLKFGFLNILIWKMTFVGEFFLNSKESSSLILPFQCPCIFFFFCSDSKLFSYPHFPGECILGRILLKNSNSSSPSHGYEKLCISCL